MYTIHNLLHSYDYINRVQQQVGFSFLLSYGKRRSAVYYKYYVAREKILLCCIKQTKNNNIKQKKKGTN